MHKERITLEDSGMVMLGKMAEGNPGAVNVLMQLCREAPHVDPHIALGGIGYVLLLDSYGVYGPDIWVLYKDICDQNIVLMMVALRARQLGIIGSLQRPNADTIKAVQERLPEMDLSSLSPEK